MNRCIEAGAFCWRWKISAALGLALSLAGATSFAQTANAAPGIAQDDNLVREQSTLPQIGVRQFPKNAKRATMQMQMPPEVLINGQLERLSAGHRIRSMANMLVMSGQVVGQVLQVNYLRNTQGEIHEVWILNQREALEEREGGGPIRNFSFGSNADMPVRDDGKTSFDKLPKYKN